MINRDRKKNIVRRAAGLLIACMVSMVGLSLPAHADVATDTLTVKVGYGGMELSEYVEAGKYNWRELRDKLGVHQVAYSYFQSESKTKYTAIVDAAQGFYITDILSLADIHYGDVRSLKFYVEDHQGIRTSFDKSALFASRYYYDDVAGHRTIVYGKKTVKEEQTEVIHHDAEYKTETYIDEETGEEKTREVLVKDAWDEEVTHIVEKEVEDKSKIVEYKFDKAANHASQVQPMLAIEDNWGQFNEEFEHCAPDYSSMNAGNRFRLLFGQTSPTESLTSKSDKYVSCVYVTLEGAPVIDDMGKMDGKRGSHKVDMRVSANNKAVRDALSKLMNIKSTNTDVLVITGIKVTPDDTYSDLARVTVSYDIVGEGEASITAGVGASSEPLAVSETVTGGASSDDSQDQESKDQKQSQDENKNKKAAGKNKGKKASSDAKKSNKAADGRSQNSGSSERANTSKVEKKTNEINRQDQQNAQGIRRVNTYLLSDAAAENFDKSMMEQAMPEIAPTEKVDQVKIKDNTKEKEQHKRQLLLFTGLGCLALGAGGSVTELVSFKVRLKGVRKQWS